VLLSAVMVLPTTCASAAAMLHAQQAAAIDRIRSRISEYSTVDHRN